MKRITCGFLGLFLACALAVISASAQTVGGTIHGTVTDAQGLSVADAKVTITNEKSGVTVTMNTNSSGIYNYLDLLVGTYSITVQKEGFEKLVRPGVQIFADQVIEVPVTLTLGSISTTVEVISGSPVVQTTTSQISNDFDARQVTELPNPDLGGSPLSLALLAPNSTGQTSGLLGEGGSIGGMRPRFNSFTIDGADDNRQDVNGHSQDVIPESIAEFNLLTNQFSAEYGHSAGGQFNTITKSGTNTWNGDAWEYNQNRNYDAMDNLNHQADLGQPPRFDFNRFGGDVGGPIIKNRLFIYGAFAQRVEGLATQAVAQTAPTADGLATLKSISDSAVNTILDQFPTAAAQGTNTDGSPIVRNVTVPGTSCSAGCAIPFGPIFPVAPNFENWKDFIINADLTWGQHSDSFHVLYDRTRQPLVNGDTPQSQFTGAEATDTRKYIFKDTWILSDKLVNDFRASYSRFVQALTVPSAFANFPNAEVDVDGLDIGPQGCAPQSSIINTYQLVDNMSYVRGKHTLKWGAEWTNWISPGFFLPRSRGEWDYANINELVNDFVPTGANGALRGAGDGGFPSNADGVGLYIQDDWKVTPKLTLNLGLRYEWNGVLKGDALQNLNSISDLPGAFTFGTPKADWNNWGPRIGVAYDPFGDGKWAIRAGFAVSYDVTPTNFPSISLPPQLQTEQNPQITCNAAAAPAWCADFNAGGKGAGFLEGGGLLQINVPCTTQADCRASTGSTIVNVVEPKILTYTLGVQHDLGWNSSLEVRYLGTRGLELPIQDRLNTQSGFDAGLAALPTYFSSATVPGAVTSPAATLQTWDNFENNSATCPAGQPSPFIFGAEGFCGALVTGFPPLGSSSYNALSVDFNHRVGHGLSLRANYTYSRTEDDATNELNSSKVNPRRALDSEHLDYGLSALDVPQRLALSWVYQIPGYHGDSALVRGATSGWQFAGTWLAAKGTPVTILNDSDANGNLDSAGDRPLINPTASGAFNSATPVDFVCNDGAGGATRIVPLSAQNATTGFIPCGTGNDANVVGYVAEDSTAKYVFAQLGVKTNLKVNTFRSPGINTWDMSFAKTTKINERFSLQFSVGMYDIFNHRSYSLTQPSVFQQTVVNATSTTYSSIQATPELGGTGFLDPTQFSGGSRSMQFGLKLSF